jgi:hypothetical protein
MWGTEKELRERESEKLGRDKKEWGREGKIVLVERFRKVRKRQQRMRGGTVRERQERMGREREREREEDKS